MLSLRKALLYSFIGRYATLTVDFVAVMIISRILTPKEIGLYSLAAASIVIGQIIRDFGLSLYIIQEKELTNEKLQTCFTTSILLCWIIALVYFLSASAVGAYFESDDVETLIKILSINFVVIPFGMITLSVLRKKMAFDTVMKIDIGSTFARVIITIGYAMMDGGVYALAAGSVVGTAASACLAMRYANFNHYRFNFHGLKKIVSFSSTVSLSNIVGELRQIIPEFMIGKYYSVEGVAFYSKASATSGLFSKLILQAAGPAIQPYIARLKNNDSELAWPLLRIFNFIQIFSIPFYCFMFAFSEPIIFLLYGEQWGQVPELLKVICISMVIVMTLPSFEQFLNVVGHQFYVMQVGLGLLAVRIGFVIYFVVYDLTLVELLYLFMCISVLRLILYFPKLLSVFSVVTSNYVKILAKNLFIAAILAVTFYLYIYVFEFEVARLAVMISLMFCTLVVWVVLLVLTRHEILEEFHRLQIFSKIKNKLKIQRK